MTDLVRYHQQPTLAEPTLLIALEGWFDAGAAAAAAAQAVLDVHPSELFAEFDVDQLLDLRARRPVVTLEEGVMRELKWPSIELRTLTDTAGRDVLLLVGAEPDHAWRPFVDVIVAIARGFGTRMVVGLGAYPAPVPHTRDPQLGLTSASEEMLDSLPGYVRGSIVVPAGAQTAIEMATHQAGIPTLGLWVQVPHYISGLPYPAASTALLDGLQRISGIEFSRGSLADQAVASRSQLDELVADNEQHQQMVQQLEELYDSQDQLGFGPLPTGDELAAEFQAFLRDQQE
ncbi:MAG: PAC2 family protein [Microthrixaceae bacterium]|nr:PAC2 family protein [Microthrixaceae bacterium]